MAAGETEAKVHPSPARLQTFLTPVRCAWHDVVHLIEMAAGGHGLRSPLAVAIWTAGMQRRPRRRIACGKALERGFGDFIRTRALDVQAMHRLSDTGVHHDLEPARRGSLGRLVAHD